MKISTGYFKHPITGEIIKPGEAYQEFDKRAVMVPKIKTLEESAKSEACETQLPTDNGKDISLSEYSLTELKKIAKDANVEGYSKMSREELISFLSSLQGVEK